MTAAASVYVGAWLVGLVLAPASPGPEATAAQVGSHYADHASSIVASSISFHGVAAVALAVFAASLASVTRAQDALRRAVVATGLLAAALSLVQVGLALIAASGVQDATAQDLFQALNVVDVAKITLLAGLVAASTAAMSRAGFGRRWLRLLAGVLVPLLPLGSAALVVDNSALLAALSVSLVLLLTWVAGTGVTVGRQVSHGLEARGRSGSRA